MTDDLEPSRLLASAALDDEVDADERARVESSPELQHELETYRHIAAQLCDVEVPALGRDSAIVAALAAFDELHAPATMDAATAATAATTAAVVSLHDRHRRRQQLWVGRVAGGMAAAAVVAVIGVAALNSGSGDDKKSSSTVVVFDQSAATAAKSAPGANATLSSAAATETMPNIATGTGGATATTDPWFAAPSFTNPEELRAYALVAPSSTVTADTTADTTAATTATSMAATTAAEAAPVPTPFATCLPPSSVSVVPAFYAGQRVYLLRDEVAGMLRVLDPATCAEILAVPLP